ncbi:MAG TPA: hypothetical protein VJI74_01685 [Candidatus Paceibacterota bacterium]
MDPVPIQQPPVRPPAPPVRPLFRQYPHYYGDIVRGLFLFSGAILLIFGASHPAIVPLASYIIPVLILLMVVLAGATNPRQYWVVAADTAVAILGLVIFEFSAIERYREIGTTHDFVFLVQQFLALVFFFTLYYASKSLRGKHVS